MGNLLNTCVPPIHPTAPRSPKTISQQYNASHCAASSQEVNLNLTISTISHQEDTSPHRHEFPGDGVQEDTEGSPEHEHEPEHEPGVDVDVDVDAQQATEPGSELQTRLQTRSQFQPDTEQETAHQAESESESGSEQPRDVMTTRPILNPALVDDSKHRMTPMEFYSKPGHYRYPDHEARRKVDRSVWK